MANIICPKCGHAFSPEGNYVVKGGAAAAGAAAGAVVGSSIGIVAGPLGGIAGTVPGAIIGGTFAYLGISKFARCPACGGIFMI